MEWFSSVKSGFFVFFPKKGLHLPKEYSIINFAVINNIVLV